MVLEDYKRVFVAFFFQLEQKKIISSLKPEDVPTTFNFAPDTI